MSTPVGYLFINETDGHYRLNGQSYSYTMDQDYYDHISQQTYLEGSIITLPVGEAFIGEII